MQWEFTAEDVVKGEVEYGVREFRSDLFEEVNANTRGWLDENSVLICFDVVYDYCYWIATGRKHEDFIVMPDSPVDMRFLSALREPLAPNVEMLGAILQRMIMDGVEQGLSLEQALAGAATRHASLVSEPVVPRCERLSGDHAEQHP